MTPSIPSAQDYASEPVRYPPLVVVDEPTANLDRESGQMVTGLILSLCRETDSTLLAVSHDVELLGRLEQVFALTAGRLAPADPMALLS